MPDLMPTLTTAPGFQPYSASRVYLGLEFVDSVDRQKGLRIASDSPGIHHGLGRPRVIGVDAIHQVDVVVVTHAVGALRERAAAGVNHHARTELQQVREVAAIQWQTIDDIALQSSAQLCVGGIYQRNGFRHGDRLRHFTWLELKVDANILIYFQNDVLAFGRLETFSLPTDHVRAGNKVGRIVLTGLVRGQRSRRASLRVVDRHCGAFYHPAALVREGSQDSPRAAL